MAVSYRQKYKARLLGTDAMILIQEKLEWVKTDLDAWQQVAVSTDYTNRNSEVIVGS